MKKNVLVVCAHPDDEVLGCGGTLKKHTSNGDEVFLLVFTNGADVRYDSSMRQTLQESCRRSSAELGIRDIIFEDFPEQRLDSLPLIDMAVKVEQTIEKVRPEIIYTHHKGDINQDHRAVFEATMIASRPLHSGIKEVYSFELPSSTEWCTPFEEKVFIPNLFVNIDDEIDTKVKAFLHYHSEVRDWPHSRSEEGIRTFARYRGMQSFQQNAEAFMLIRKVVS